MTSREKHIVIEWKRKSVEQTSCKKSLSPNVIFSIVHILSHDEQAGAADCTTASMSYLTLSFSTLQKA